MTTLDQLDHQEDELRNPTGLSELKNAISEGRKPNPGKEEPTWPEMIKGDGDNTQIPENDGNVNSMDWAKAPENPEKEEPTWPETAKEIGDNPEAPEDGESISDLFVRKDLASQIIFPEKVEFTTKIADKAEKYFNDRKDSLDEKKYKKAMTALWIFINVQRKKAVKNGSLDLDATRKWLNWSPMNDEEDRFITEGFLKRLEEEEREIVSK